MKKLIAILAILTIAFPCYADIFVPDQPSEEERIVGKIRRTAPQIRQAEATKCRVSFLELWGCDGKDLGECRSIELMDKVMALFGKNETLQMFQWHGAWQEWLALNPNYTPLVPPYVTDCTTDPCTVRTRAEGETESVVL